MKKFLLVLILFVIGTNAQTWEKVLDNTFPPLSDIFFYSENRGWVCGNSGSFAQTTDGGQTWLIDENFPGTHSLYSIFFLTKMVGYVGSYGSVIYKTTDGGASWTEQYIGNDNNLSIKSIYFGSDQQTGWCLASSTSNSKIFKTTDGGTNWSEVFSVSTEIQSMAFSSPGHGICTGKNLKIYYTTDGENWQAATSPSLPPGYSRTDVRGVAMANDDVAYAVGWGTRALGLQPSILLKTTDGGQTWDYLSQEPENRQYVNLYTVIAIDENTAIAGGGSAYDGSVIIKTTDGGQNWVRVNAPFGFSVKALNKIGNRIWGTGSGGVTIYSDDGGDNWQMANQIPSTSPWAGFYDGNNLMAVGGYGGLLLLSKDGGNSWTPHYAFNDGVCPSIQDIFFLNNNVGYLARNNRVVSKTTDGGETWFTIMPDTTDSKVVNYCVQFLNENVGYVAGKSGSHVSAFYKTTDGGQSWIKQFGIFPEKVNDLYFWDENTGVIVGDNLTAYYTLDGASSWIMATLNGSVDSDDDLNGVTFYDNNFGLAYGDELFKTTDGGHTWDYVSISPYNIEIKSASILENENHWIVVGKTKVLETTDGGNSWTDIADLSVITSTQLYTSFADKTGRYWVSGGTSEIYKTVNPVGVTAENTNIPKEFVLYQNYPNPFNPTTTIKFTVPRKSYVKLKIFDSLGKEVATLINKKLESGTYSINFDANKFTSGIYFYSLVETNEFSNLKSVKKMILLK